jgi:succinyl-diaminopimelate desuccinylase
MKTLLKKLVQTDTSAGKGELTAAKIISEEFRNSGIDSQVDSWDQIRANIVARVKSTGKKPALLFVCHLDVVPPGEGTWKYPPFDAVEAEGKIHGRGSTDMRGGLSSSVSAICEIVKSGAKLQGDIIFCAAAGEETDSIGARRFVKNWDKNNKLTGVVIPEPTGFDVVIAHRGILWLKVTTKGKTAHGSAPHLGINAIMSMRAFLNELDNFKFDVKPHKQFGQCSMSVNTISGGKAINVIPDRCIAEIDIRTLPGQKYEPVIEGFKKIFAKLKAKDPKFDAEVEIVRATEAMETDSKNPFVKEFCTTVGINETKVVGFTTDGSIIKQLGYPIVIFGPGDSGMCHKPDEFIEIAAAQKAVDYYKKIILKFLT